MIDKKLTDRLGAFGAPRPLNICGAHGMRKSEKKARFVTCDVRGDGQTLHKVHAYALPELKLPWTEIDGECIRPSLLIGQNHAGLIVTRELRECEDGRFWSRTELGWTLHGGSDYRDEGNVNLTTDSELDELLKQNFAIESLGVSAYNRDGGEKIQRARQLMQATTVRLKNGRWQTGLLWDSDDVDMPNNQHAALSRFHQLERKFQGDATLKSAYHEKMRDLLAKGYARPATSAEVADTSSRTWYLPHFAVTHPNKPGKFRIVFDAASKCKGVSLNDRLLTGPDLLSSLLGNLMRFREGPVAIAADIREMFLRIGIQPEDQQTQRFFWRQDEHSEPQIYVLTSMMFGSKSSPTSAHFVRNKAAEVCQEEFPEAAAAVQENFYMDDLLKAAPTAEAAKQTVRDITTILARSGFELANWASNDASVLRGIPAARKASAAVNIAGADLDRVLGVLWDPARDTFIFGKGGSTIAEAPDIPTKRELLSHTMKIFDPAGFITCLTVRSKILLQEIWRSGTGWDTPISDAHAQKWREWRQLMAATDVAIPRCTVWSRENEATLHVFSDASELACCAVAYRVEKCGTECKVVFLAAKTKVAPLRPISIPRLELQAALMAARLAATIKRESTVSYSRVCYWTDSTTVLCWLRTDPRRYSVFVANRLGELDELSNKNDWRWVPTAENTADIGTRDGDPPDMSAGGRWFRGPAFITGPEANWPKERAKKATSEDELEVRAKYVGHVTCKDDYHQTLERHSSWRKLIRTSAWVRRFLQRCRRDPRAATGDTLAAAELDAAEKAWIIRSQKEAFAAERANLLAGRPLDRISRLKALDPAFDADGILRMSTRLEAVRARKVCAPIILDGDDPYARLYIRHVHEKEHASAERTVSELRDGFFVLKMRTNTRMIAHRCLACRHARARPNPPLMGQLPKGRLADGQRPFTHCGLDFFGPMSVTIGRRREKRYGALFTCLTTRAVHLELAASLSTDSAIQAIRRMTARRGQPTTLYSDNGTNFRGADREMAAAVRTLQDDPRWRDELANSRIEWKFLPPAAPHMGGAWERLVGSVKRALKATLKEQSPREETLATALAEAEFTVNSRPLTHISVDPRDESPLTPNHFLIGSAKGRSPLAYSSPGDENTDLRKQWRYAQRLADMFWRRWIREYRPSLAQRPKWRERVAPIEVGDLVLIVDPTLPRNAWPRGRVVTATPAADGQVRMVRVKTATGNVYSRPATKIAVLCKKVFSKQ